MMRRIKLVLCRSIFYISVFLLFSGCATSVTNMTAENEQGGVVVPWTGGTYSPRLLPDMSPDNAVKILSEVFRSAQRIDDNVGFKLSGKLDINGPSNQANLKGYLKSVYAYIIVRDPGGEFKYMLSRSSITVLGDRININPAFSLFYVDLIDRPISVQKIEVEDIRCSWPDVNWNLVNDTIAGKYGIEYRPVYKRPYMIRCGSLVSLFFKRQTDAEKVADALFSMQTGLEKTLAERKAKLELLAPQYRELAIKPSLSEEQRKSVVLADMMTERKDYSQAIRLYIEVINLDPVSYPEAYLNLAMLSEQMKRYNMAAYYMKLYLMLAPDAPDARDAQDKIYKWDYMFQENTSR